MKCPKCEKEATYDWQFISVQYYFCEFCGHRFGYIDDGVASEEAISGFQKRLQMSFENKAQGWEPAKETLKKAGISLPEPQNVKMHNPGDGIRMGTPQAGSGDYADR